eukprot:753151-Hanusia_phi.AAC.1
MCILVVLASIMLWDNVGLGKKGKGYQLRRSSTPTASSQPAEEWKRRIRQAATAKKMQERKVKRILAERALDLSEQAAIAEIANTYAPESWFASHKRPERGQQLIVTLPSSVFPAAILAVTRNPREGDKIVDQVEGQMLDTHYKGQDNSVARGVKDLLPGMSRRRRNEIIEPLVEASTQRALHRLSLEVPAAVALSPLNLLLGREGLGGPRARRAQVELGLDRRSGEERDCEVRRTRSKESPAEKRGASSRAVSATTSWQHAPAGYGKRGEGRGRIGEGWISGIENDRTGLGNVKSPQEAAKALEHLARKTWFYSELAAYAGEGKR